VSAPERLGLFEATGIELEYMIVDRDTLDVRPLTDRVLAAAGGRGEMELARDGLVWSCELALHVLELKTRGPARRLAGLPALFHQHVRRIDAILEPSGARLMPTAMHPWMDPAAELELWPHEAAPVYRALHEVFDCREHGWANIQSAQLNLPFRDDEEFGRLHAAIRLLLPVLPALAASSPLADGRLTGWLDTRMEYYRHHARRIPSIAGRIVPERLFTRAEYERLLASIYADLAPHDPGEFLRREWVNARGCVARFDRGTIEIRVLDMQEHPAADLAVCAAVRAAVRGLTEGRLGDPARQRDWSEEVLGTLLADVVREADHSILGDREYLRALGFPDAPPVRASELWQFLVDSTLVREPEFEEFSGPLGVILREGCLARRIVRRLGAEFTRPDLQRLCRDLCDCLARGRSFSADA
jgi:gamma-glutamyl:cysteine ligase YbdK (ATP-grasp superfamily)